MGDVQNRVEEATLSGDSSQHFLVRRILGPASDNAEHISDRLSGGYFNRWVHVPVGTIATAIAEEKFWGSTFIVAMLPDGEVIRTDASWWARVR